MATAMDTQVAAMARAKVRVTAVEIKQACHAA